MSKSLIIHFFILLVFVVMVNKTQAQITFEKVIDTLGSAGALGVIQTTDGGYIASGKSYFNGNDVSIIKLDSMGLTEWVKVYTGPGVESATQIVQLPDGGYLVDAAFDIGLNSLNWLLRLDMLGDTIWTKKYSVGPDATNSQQMIITDNGRVALAGYYSTQSKSDAYLIITDTSGNLISSHIYNTPIASNGYAVTTAINNGYALTGQFASSINSSDFLLIRTDSIGDMLWTKTYNISSNDAGYAISATNDGGFIIAGNFWNNATIHYNIGLIKTDSLGNVDWYKTYLSSVTTEAFSVHQTADSGYAIFGNIVNGMPINRDFYLIRTNEIGDTLWTRQYGGLSAEYGYCMGQTSDNGFILGGSTSSFGNGGTYLIKTNDAGDIISFIEQIADNPTLSLDISPNPSFGNFSITLDSNEADLYTVTIQNISGMEIYSNMLVSGKATTIEIGTVPKGIYFLHVTGPTSSITKKIIIN